ncbi:MAG TPA: hypothetical protein H9813_08980 [Candidatus Fournierella merdipullorum]|uniref:Uncharacterized protein n=1 Tax=Candidatus Allofournierella merdipullorum TaxID=2838595 RepID=A0A9D2J051_9FIRM|nr:hypothetical protein [Candidatus Fournierella merdipullorum]
MFFDPKMQLVWVDGPLEKLDAFIEGCCVDGKRVHPARALDHMSASAGYAALNEDNPWGPMVEQIEALAKGFEIPVVEPTLADGRAQGTRDYLADLNERLETHRKDRELLEKQLEICTKGAESFAHFSSLDVPVELTQQCEYVKIRFGRLPKRGYAMLQKDFSSDPYILFVPCSEDDKALWGVYFAPKKDAARVDGIFSEAFFERVRLPGAAGTPEQIVANLQKNIELLNSEIAEVNGQMARLWNEEKWKVAGIYASVCSLARLFELRRCAAVRGEHFFYCVWVAQPDIPAFTDACSGVGGLNLAQDMTMPMRRWKQENPEQ